MRASTGKEFEEKRKKNVKVGKKGGLTGGSTLMEAAGIGSAPIDVGVFENGFSGFVGRINRRIGGRSCTGVCGHCRSLL